MVGKTVSHYKIIEKLGAGGMGVVYKAEDSKLKRTVALKFLPPELTRDPDAKERFIREAQAASSLQHNNICTIHDIDETADSQLFMVMDCYEGQTLKEKINSGPLKIDESLDIAIQIAEGLQEAHEKGIIHRDIKSSNIMISSKKQIKITDFGLAKLSGQTKLTQTGTTVGTVAYMSPEQSRSLEVDRRTDIWSFGVLLYEMITGQLPFKGEYDQAVVYSIINDEPEPPTALRTGVPIELERVIAKAILKDPEKRYQHVDELLVDLRNIRMEINTNTRAKTGKKKTGMSLGRVLLFTVPFFLLIGLLYLLIQTGYITRQSRVSETMEQMIVVLPFENMGPTEDVYFTHGITDEITSRLSVIPKIGVISRNSASHYAGQDWDTRQVGKDLNVDYIVAGTVRWGRANGARDRVRITPRLIRVMDDIEVWSHSFDRIIDDIFNIQSEIAVKVVEELGITLGESERNIVKRDATIHLEAYQAFLQGRHRSRSPHFTVDNWKRVIQSYQRAVELDSSYALAFAELAAAHARLRYLRHDLSDERLSLAKEAAARAKKLSKNTPEVLLALGYYQLWAYLDREQAMQLWDLAEKSLTNDPRILEARATICANLGLWDEGIETLEKAIKHSPKDASLITDLVLSYWMKRNYSKAIKLCNHAITLAPDENWPYIYKSIITWIMQGSSRESRNAIASVNQAYHWVPWLWFWQNVGEGQYDHLLRQLSDNPDEWIQHKLWARPRSMFRAFVYDFIGKPELAFEAYEASVPLLEAKVQKWPQDPRYHSSLGMAYAALGRKEEAISEGGKAIELLPLSKDAEYGQAYEMDMILIYIMVGEFDAAMDKIEFLLSKPAWLSIGWMNFDLRHRPLYDNPRFEKIIEKYSRNIQ